MHIGRVSFLMGPDRTPCGAARRPGVLGCLDDAVVLLVLAIASSRDLGGDDAVDRPGLRSTRCMKLTNTGSTIQMSSLHVLGDS